MIYIALFIGILSIVSFIKPRQQSGWENGIFINKITGNVITIDNGIIIYGKSRSYYTIWIGKGKRFLSPNIILGNMYNIEYSSGKKVPAEMILDNKKDATSVCSVENGSTEICFSRMSS